MKVSASAPSDSQPANRRVTWLVATGLAVYFAAHLPFLAPSLEDIDSMNYALGLREFDVARHQPHPPGSVAYIGLGRLSLALINGVAPALDRVGAETLALSIWSALAAPIAVVAAFFVYQACSPRAAPWAAALLAAAPLFWISALRPMSDMPGLAAALVTQAVLLQSQVHRKLLVWGAAAAGLAAGIRLQTIWLTVPLLAFALFHRRREGLGWPLFAPVLALTAAVVAWVVPLVAASGGLDQYVRALGSQADADFAWVDMLWANPTPRRLALSLVDTFVTPWGAIPLAIVVAAAAAIGTVAAFRDGKALLLLFLAFAPYVAFHLLFHETAHVRYALPAVVPVVWLAARGVASLGRAAPAVQAAIVAIAASVAVDGARAYAAEPHPAFRAISDMTRAAAAERPAAVYSHYAVRRPLQVQPPGSVPVVEPPMNAEWKDLIEYWRGGGSAPVWFLADTRRTDLALIDPEARVGVARYRWQVAGRSEFAGARPTDVDWYRFNQPGWFAGDGWSLTPELGGITQSAGTGVDRRPIEAMVLRRPERTVAVIGARHLGAPSDGGVTFSVAVDGRPIDRWELDPARGPNVVRVLDLPPGTLSGEGRYARLTITAVASVPGVPTPPVAVRQFDIQPGTGLLHAFDEGWHEAEYDNATGLRWRWTSDRSILRIVPNQSVRLRLRGESPLKYFDAPPTVRVRAGDQVLAEFRPAEDFEWRLTIPEAAMAASDGRVAIETDPVYLPGEAEGTGDVRRLGLRLFEIDVARVSP
jgi:hypothetical protein